ncbi:MAG: response regulator [Bacteroidetes bacterium]|nr:response regulator [Bacteroidota bacterium]
MRYLILANSTQSIPINKKRRLSKIITSKKELRNFFNDELHTKLQGIIIQLELKWYRSNSLYSSFSGIDLIQYLRLEFDCWIPITITSYLAPSLIISKFQKSKPWYKPWMFRDPSITFKPLKKIVSTVDLSYLFEEPITDDRLKLDLSNTIYKRDGYVGENFHRLSSKVRQVLNERGFDFPLISMEISTSFKLLEGQFSEFSKMIWKNYDRIIDGIQGMESKEKILEFLEARTEKLQNKLIRVENSHQPILPTVKVVYIDDVENDRRRLKAILKKFRINCIVVSNENEAVAVLKKNKYIHVVLCDYRFYDSKDKIARKQGYHMMSYVEDSIRRRFYFIGMTGYNDIRRPVFFDWSDEAHLFNKKDLKSEVRCFDLASTIRKKHEELSQKKTPRNQQVFKNKDHQKFYEKHKNDKDYETVEKEIAGYAFRFVQAVKNGENLHRFERLEGWKTNPKNVKWTLKQFRIILKTRRTALGLFQLEKFNFKRNGGEILMLLDQSDEVREQGYASRSITTFLELGSKERQKIGENIEILKLTDEERTWLENHLSDF